MKRSVIRDYYGSEQHTSERRQMFTIIPGYLSFSFPPSTLLIRETK